MRDIKIYGYMRVSSKEQNEDRQRIALTEMGVPVYFYVSHINPLLCIVLIVLGSFDIL